MDSYTVISLPDWEAYSDYVQNFSGHWAFRGQGIADWILNNAIERTEFISHHNDIEAEFIAEFQRGARNYLHRDELPEHLIEWLALMQHHGAPTRLLDLTKSPYIAAYFAFEEALAHADYNVAIWCINVAFLKNRAIEILSSEFGDELQQTNNVINERVFEKLFYNNSKSLVFPVEPFRMNRRYSLQQSIFISTGTSAKPLMEQLAFLGKDLSKTVVKLVLPARCRKVALRELQKMNLNRASLFPDLDGYALSLKLRYDNQKSPVEHAMEIDEKRQRPDYPFHP